MFLTSTDFTVAPYIISSQVENTNGINAYIADTEEAILEKLLGSTFYAQLKAGVNAFPAEWVSNLSHTYDVGVQVVYGADIYESTDNNNATVPSQSLTWILQPVNKWLRLKKGDTYTNEGKENTWKGFVTALKPYVHSQYLKEYDMTVAPLGVVKPVSENSSIVSPNQIIVRHYNRFAEMVGSYDGIGLNGWYLDAFFDDMYFADLYGYFLEDSLYGYLYYKSSLFDADVNTKGWGDFREYLYQKFWFPGYLNLFNI
jgi:hypothetical protein